jgi:cellulose synthase/poly-beta-1,6-N-acetylglucosamine synthase-like glycosyltransferase
MSSFQQPAQEPLLSVVIPARDNREQLLACLRSLQKSDFRDFDVIVVDDASTESIADVMGEFGARFVRLSMRQGPGAARNHGVYESRGEYILFLDSDVCVHPDTLRRIAAVFAADATIDAVFGSYDAQPIVRNLVSQYRNLLHHFVHQMAKSEASTFWAGCGAIRRSVFQESGGFDSAQDCRIEDIELGMRLCQSGHRIRLDRRILVTHQKHWTFWSMLKADIFYRALPWARLVLRAGRIPNDLNLKRPQRMAALLAWALMATLAAGAARHFALWAGPLLVMVLVVALDRLTHHPLMAVIVGYAVSAIMLGSLFAYWLFLGWWVTFPIALSVAIVFINRDFYRLLARKRNLTFAFFVFPLNVLFYLYSSVAFAWAAAQHLWFPAISATPEPFRPIRTNEHRWRQRTGR